MVRILHMVHGKNLTQGSGLEYYIRLDFRQAYK